MARLEELPGANEYCAWETQPPPPAPGTATQDAAAARQSRLARLRPADAEPEPEPEPEPEEPALQPIEEPLWLRMLRANGVPEAERFPNKEFWASADDTTPATASPSRRLSFRGDEVCVRACVRACVCACVCMVCVAFKFPSSTHTKLSSWRTGAGARQAHPCATEGAACLPACLPVWLPGWVAGWLAGWLAGCLAACLPARTPACLPVCVSAGRSAWLLCLLAWLCLCRSLLPSRSLALPLATAGAYRRGAGRQRADGRWRPL